MRSMSDVGSPRKGGVPVKELTKKALASIFGLNKGKMGGVYKWVD